MKNNLIKMSFPPAFVVDYAKKMLAHARKGKNNGPGELAVLADIVTMLEVAESVMTPSQPDAGNTK